MAQTFHRYRAGDKPVGGYKLIRKLGEGGFGEVWQASAPGGAEVALKFIDLTGQQGFREFKSLRLVKKITHNNLTPLHGFWLKNEDGTLIDESDVTWSQIAPVPVQPGAPPSGALATAIYTHPVELIVAMGLGRKSLYDRLRECLDDEGLGGIPADELLDYMEDAAKGIDYLNKPIHDMGHGPVPIVHSDIKPHNILIVGDGAQVCDFGLAHAVEALRKTCAAPLTLAYAAPESFRGKPCDKSDQYSLAISYVELRTGSLPFDETLTGYEVMTAHVQGQLDFARLTPGEAAVIRRATAPLPQDRWRSSREMIIELRKTLRLSSDSNFMADEAMAAPAHWSGPPPIPDRAHTMMPPGSAASETSPFSGLTPSQRDPALLTRTPATAKPILAPVAERPAPATHRRMSTGAKLFIALLLLVVIGGVAGYQYSGVDWFAKGKQPEKDDIDNPVLPPVSNDDREAYSQHLDRSEFSQALDRLKESAFTLDEIALRRGEVLQKWRDHAKYNFLEGRFARAAAEYEQLANRFSDLSDADDFKLMQARSKLADLDFAGAGTVFAGVQTPDKRETRRDRSYFLAKLLVDVKGDVNAAPPEIRLGELHAVWLENPTEANAPKASAAGDIWAPSKNELGQLKEARAKVVQRWIKDAENRRDEKGLADLTKIVVIDQENVDAWLAKADTHLELDQTDEATTALAERFKLGGQADDVDIQRREELLTDYYRLVNAASDAPTITGALANVPTFLQRFPDRQAALAAAVLQLAENQNYLPQAVEALRGALESDNAAPALRSQFAKLLQRDVERRLHAEPVFANAAKQLRRDCEFLARQSGTPADVPEIIRACLAECRLELKLPNPQEGLGTVGATPYFHYVRARVLAATQGNAQEIQSHLKQLFAKSAPTTPSWTERNVLAVKLVDSIADQVRPAMAGFDVEAMLKQPAATTAAARETFDLLKNAYRWTNPPLLSLPSRANLAIAAWWLKNSPDDGALAQTLSREVAAEWLKSSVRLPDDRRLQFSLYHTLLAAQAASKDQSVDALRVEAASKMIELCSDASLDDKDAAILYSTVLSPLERTAASRKNDGFFADAGRLIAANADLSWSFPPVENKAVTVSDKLDDLYTAAIDASGRKVGEYFKLRADVRSKRQPPDHKAILDDANELKKFPSFAAQAFALEGFVYFLQSRDERSVAKRFDKLQLALKSLEQAEKQSENLPKDDLDQVYYFRSMIHTERGNFAELANAGERVVPRDEFKKAIDYAKKVIDGGGGPNLQYAYEAAANAYEDLAWHARVDPEVNFKNAIDQLKFSVALNDDSPETHMALARSYYKMIVEARVNLKGASDYLQLARRELERAVELAGDGKHAEAHLWLAKVIQAAHVDERTQLDEAQNKLTDAEYKEADLNFTKAYSAAEKAKVPPAYFATYAYASAEHALFNPVFDPNSRASGNAKVAARNAVYNRAKQLEDLASGKTVRMDPLQEAKILRANADLYVNSRGKVLDSLEDDAVKITKAEPDLLTRSDAKLIELRLGLQAKLQPNELNPALVKSAVLDALWYSEAPASLVWKDQLQTLVAALRLSQQMATIDTTQITTSADQAQKCLGRITALTSASNYYFQRHLEVVDSCIKLLDAAKNPALAASHQKLRQAIRPYLQKVRDTAAKANRPAKEVTAFETFLKSVPQ